MRGATAKYCADFANISTCCGLLILNVYFIKNKHLKATIINTFLGEPMGILPYT